MTIFMRLTTDPSLRLSLLAVNINVMIKLIRTKIGNKQQKRKRITDKNISLISKHTRHSSYTQDQRKSFTFVVFEMYHATQVTYFNICNLAV
jgi:hypothetical protein